MSSGGGTRTLFRLLVTGLEVAPPAQIPERTSVETRVTVLDFC